MAILAFPRFLSTTFSQNLTTHSFGSKPVLKMSTQREVRSTAAAEHTNSGDAAVIWFKHDLRIDDHIGLVAASQYRTIIPLYVFDHRILSSQFSFSSLLQFHVLVYYVYAAVLEIRLRIEDLYCY